MKFQTFAILTLFYAPVLAAQNAANWTQQSPQTIPPLREGQGMAFDSAHGQVVMLGGEGAGFTPLNDTWVWDGSNWTQKSPQNSPPAQDHIAIAYDSAHGQTVYFCGGDNGTWLWDGSNWTQKLPPNSPAPRSHHGMVYDSAHGQVVMFGGLGASFNTLNETWVWDGSSWTQESPQNSPSPRSSFAMAYDSVHGQTVLFGGFDAASNALGDTWVWDGSNWTQEFPQTLPPARFQFAMAYDSAHRQVVMFGGEASVGLLNDTWAWDGSNWTLESPQTSPSKRYSHAMAYDSAHDLIVLFGGDNLNDTWTWDSGALPPPSPSVTAVVSASDFGGFTSVAPGSWVEIYGSNLAPDTQGWTSADFMGNNAPTMLNGVSVSIGGQAAFINYVSAAQVNAQLPSNIATGGTLELTVTNANGPSSPMNVTVNPTEPGLLAPPSFKIGSNQYVVAQHSDGSYVLPVGAISGATSSPAKPGEIVVIYGVGFGPVTPDIPAGEIATETNQLSASFEVLFGKTSAKLPYFGLAPNFVGLYQFNVTVPAVANNDLEPLTFNLSGAAGTQTLYTAVQQ